MKQEYKWHRIDKGEFPEEGEVVLVINKELNSMVSSRYVGEYCITDDEEGTKYTEETGEKEGHGWLTNSIIRGTPFYIETKGLAWTRYPEIPKNLNQT